MIVSLLFIFFLELDVVLFSLIQYFFSLHPIDRYILLGNHHDTWVFGAIDPLSGTAAMHEIARTLGHFNKMSGRFL